MSRLLVRNFSISLDGYAAGPHQDLDNPLGVGGTQLHEWIFATRSGSQMIGNDGGARGSTTTSSRSGDLVWVPPSWDGTCSARFVARGARAIGLAGGERNLPFITRSSCSPATRILLSKCREEQPSISSTAGSKQL